MESQRFASISNEFTGLMRKVGKSPKVLDVLQINGVQRSLQRLADLLQKIQKALGEYLERERSQFPRFYFVGDEDLLEIIGNSKALPRLQKHFKKMFAGVHSLLLEDADKIIRGIASQEGEEVIFDGDLIVSTEKHSKINDWLSRVELSMKTALAKKFHVSFMKFNEINLADGPAIESWLDTCEAQLVPLCAQLLWSKKVDACFTKSLEEISKVEEEIEESLRTFATAVLGEQPPLRRRKLEELIKEFVHLREVTRTLVKDPAVADCISEGGKILPYSWQANMRLQYDNSKSNVEEKLSLHVANTMFLYGYEYLGVQESLVKTPLTDRCYLTMTQALQYKLGGSPFGPAGTGKTETVKSLGSQLGRFVLVFNCDEAFDLQAMGRIFVGLCQVGAWGCFDEFNRLEERILSSVSQQIQIIQEALKLDQRNIELIGKQVNVSKNTGIFITMNPGYAGRSPLPDNLKRLFRSLAMTKPNKAQIAQVMLFSQGFRTAEILASKVVPLFNLCSDQLTKQSHYDFGLRALKYILIAAGNIKRDKIKAIMEKNPGKSEADIAADLPEQEILIQSVYETMLPKLVNDDIMLLKSLLQDVFPNVNYQRAEMQVLKKHIHAVCEQRLLIPSENWLDKVLQLHQIISINHGLMLVGPPGSGKTTAWKTLIAALDAMEGKESCHYVIDPKAMNKKQLYGVLDPNTREWTDGVFTQILRRIIDNVRGELNKRHWILFDGDVDPEWVENLNSVLDDSKMLTLPNGERLSLPKCVSILFEVQDLKYATLATVSRCGMIHFSDNVVDTNMTFERYLTALRKIPIEEHGKDMELKKSSSDEKVDEKSSQKPANTSQESQQLEVQNDAANILAPFLAKEGLAEKTLTYALSLTDHIMTFIPARAAQTITALLTSGVNQILEYNLNHPDFPMEFDQSEKFLQKHLIVSLVWAFAGDGNMQQRQKVSEFIRKISMCVMPEFDSSDGHKSIIDYYVKEDGSWANWEDKVPKMEVETHRVAAPDVVVPTLDTIRHEWLLKAFLAAHKPLVLCGPPGSGKTMTLLSALRAFPDMDVVGLNFSSATTPELLLKTFDHYCEYKRTPSGLTMQPTVINKWLVLFCDEINLPDEDSYGTQRVIAFIRQLVEHNGFYRPSDNQWVRLDRIQFVGACNPPTDPGRKPLSMRFLRHVPLLYVDHPGSASLKQIYGTFNRAMLRLVPGLRTYAEPLTNAMVELYMLSSEEFTQAKQPHYVYSPREMTRWVRGILESLRDVDMLPIEGLVRVWAHEALRLFNDRLVHVDERQWTEEMIDKVAMKYFPGIDKKAALERPILYSTWMSKNYVPVQREALREYVRARLKVFYEEELDCQLVLFNDVLEHVLRIDRIFRQSQGHLLLIGASGAGKTTLSRFVAWMNGLKTFQIKVHRKYTGEDFDEDLRQVLRRAGCKGQKIAFIMDESNVLDSSFLERMNTLLANGEVPGLFEGDEMTTLMTQCKEGAARDGLMLDSQDELYRWFTNQVLRNLHVVFTMNPAGDDLKDRAATSPALFNRCVLNWFGDWSNEALFQVGHTFTEKMDLDRPDYDTTYIEDEENKTQREAIVNSLVFVHNSVKKLNMARKLKDKVTMGVTPRHYLDFIKQYQKVMSEKRRDLEEQQLHLKVGLKKINETVEQVAELRVELTAKEKSLLRANKDANEKLQQMLKEQQQAEMEKKKSQNIREELAKLEKQISEESYQVNAELADVEPAVNEAKQAVSGIRKQQLVEVRQFVNPPPAVKMAMESICLMIGSDAKDWKTIRGLIVQADFIPSILQFDTDAMSRKTKETMMTKYMKDPNYTFEAVNKASKACGPLVKWAIAQLKYADMLQRIDPLRQRLKDLEKDAKVNKKEVEEMDAKIASLEASIDRYKSEYGTLIAEAQRLKNEMATVKSKVSRSVSLLDSLGGEQERWQITAETFTNQITTIAGDCLFAAAFTTYAGYFDQSSRDMLMTRWQTRLASCQIETRAELSVVDYLSTADDRMAWSSHGLPEDQLCIENASMLKRFNRFPLIIDPSGQATQFLLKQHADNKIVQTSFLDGAFRKNLESAIRFGQPLLIQDVEHYDPILNPVLNNEVRRTGGRTLITIGDQDIDLSPSFSCILTTRDPSVRFPDDICSRVTIINFTVTRSSLHSQCLSEALKTERPEVDKRRVDLLKLQGEYQLKLRHLEQKLLQTLNEAQGKILDDDSLIKVLETLKTEAADVAMKAKETDGVMAEINKVSNTYSQLAANSASIFFMLDSLSSVNQLYQFSLKFFLDIFHHCLHNSPDLANVQGHEDRLALIITTLFNETYLRAARSLLHNDRLLLAMMLAKIKITPDSNLWQQICNFQPSIESSDKKNIIEDCRILSKLNVFKDISENLYAEQDQGTLGIWLDSQEPETCTPQVWSSNNDDQVLAKLYSLLLVQILRPDRFIAASSQFVNSVFTSNVITEVENTSIDFSKICLQLHKAQPLMLCCPAGHDVSSKVDEFAANQNQKLTSIAIGSAEAFAEAERAIAAAGRQGNWVLLKNVHLACGWLAQLEKTLHQMVKSSHENFRLFMTAEIMPKLPISLLRSGRVLVFEPVPGLRSQLSTVFANLGEKRIERGPARAVRARLYFLLAWLHAVTLERRRYTPIGWTKAYEWTDADLKSAADTLDNWLDEAARGRESLPPNMVPFEALRSLFGQTIYGGKIDNDFDQSLLDTMLNKLFSEQAFDSNFTLAKTLGRDILAPESGSSESNSYSGLTSWVMTSLPEQQAPSWLGLPDNAEKVVLTEKANLLVRKLLKCSAVDFYEEAEASTASDTTGRMLDTQLAEQVQDWFKIEGLSKKEFDLNFDQNTPLGRFYSREATSTKSLYKTVIEDLTDLLTVANGGRISLTNDLRAIIKSIQSGNVPKKWQKYKYPGLWTTSVWIKDFGKRVAQTHKISEHYKKTNDLQSFPVWLGGFFQPAAWVTATRQTAAQKLDKAMEELVLGISLNSQINNKNSNSNSSFPVIDLCIHGAKITKGNQYYPTLDTNTNETTFTVNMSYLEWSCKADQQKVQYPAVTLPVYRNSTREDLLFTLEFNVIGKVEQYYERGVALVASL